MKKIGLFLISFFIPLLCSPSFAEVNQWIDDQGRTIFSNLAPPPGVKIISRQKNNPNQNEQKIISGTETECRSAWSTDEEMVKKCMYKGYADQVTRLNVEIKNKKNNLKERLYGMVDDAQRDCEKDSKGGTKERKECVRFVTEERNKLDLEYKN